MKLIKYPALIIMFALTCSSLKAQVKHSAASAKARMEQSIARGKLVFTQNCATCHREDGKGIQHMNPPLIQTTYVLGDKTKLITILLKGFNDEVEINGNSYSNTMPSQDNLKDQEIADVLTYVRNSFTNKAGAVTATAVKSVRRKIDH